MRNLELNKYKKKVKKINKYSKVMESLTDEELRAKTDEFKTKLANGSSKDSILNEAFAVVREMSKRVLGMKHYDVQLIGGMVLHDGKAAEMKTGEGKTLVATLATYLNALDGKGVHVVTVNEYLAKRDKELNEPLFNALGLTVGVSLSGMSEFQKRIEYGKDITYVTNSELGFDYLRDNMVYNISSRVLRGLHYAIIDEVDSILIDEARTPLIISGKGDRPSVWFKSVDAFVKTLKEEDYVMDRKTESISLSEKGVSKAEKIFGMTNYSNKEYTDLRHVIAQSLKANHYFKKDDRYIVRNDEIILIDSGTGRVAEGRRYSEGLHQALEAKEGVTIREDSETLATITYQNFFTMYDKLSGMSGTIKTEVIEFRETYGLDVIEIPTNLPVVREDLPDRVYHTQKDKMRAIVEEIKASYEIGQPVLVGTESIVKTEEISAMLIEKGIPHNVLNAKNNEEEASIVSRAGEKGSVTISTNMAGRGTDIKLDEDSLKVGGLKVIGTYRNENRRIDNQLRGRSGRQGDPGTSQFFISIEDDMLKTFMPQKARDFIASLMPEDGECIDDKMISKSIETSQRILEGRNYDTRKYIKKYDDAINLQRVHTYKERDLLISDVNMADTIEDVAKGAISDFIDLRLKAHIKTSTVDELTDLLVELKKEIKAECGVDIDIDLTKGVISDKAYNLFKESCIDKMLEGFSERKDDFDFNDTIKRIFLKNLDKLWIEHLEDVTALRKNMQFAGLKQQDPLPEYIMETNKLYEDFMFTLRIDSVFEIISAIRSEILEDVFDVDVELDDNMYDDKIIHNENIECESGIVFFGLNE